MVTKSSEPFEIMGRVATDRREQPSSEKSRGRRRVFNSVCWSLADYGFGRVFSFAATVYVARVVGTVAFGLYSVAVSFAQTAGVFVEFGTSAYGTRQVAQQYPNHAKDVGSITYLRLSMAVIVSVVCCLVICFLPSFASYRVPLLAACGYLISFSLAQDWYFGGLRLFRLTAVANLLKGAGLLLGCLLLVRRPQDVPLALIMYAFAPLISAGFLMLYSCRRLRMNPFSNPDYLAMLASGRRSLAFAGNSLGLALYQVAPIYVLLWLGTMGQVGTFSAAQRPVLIAASAVLPLSSSFYPYISEDYANPRRFRESQNLFQHLVLIFTVPLGVICFCYGGYLMSILYGRSYIEAQWPFQVMSLVIPLCALRLTFTHPLLASHRQNVVAALAVKATVATALLSYVLFLAWGAQGIAWAVVFGEAFFTVAAMHSARRLLSLPVFTPAWFPVGLAACAMSLAALVPVQPIIRIAMSVTLFSIVMLAFDDLAKRTAQIILGRLLSRRVDEDLVL